MGVKGLLALSHGDDGARVDTSRIPDRAHEATPDFQAFQYGQQLRRGSDQRPVYRNLGRKGGRMIRIGFP